MGVQDDWGEGQAASEICVKERFIGLCGGKNSEIKMPGDIEGGELGGGMIGGEKTARTLSLSAKLNELIMNVNCVGREQRMQEVIAKLGQLLEAPVVVVPKEQGGAGAREVGVLLEESAVGSSGAEGDIPRVAVRVLGDEGEDGGEGGSNCGEEEYCGGASGVVSETRSEGQTGGEGSMRKVCKVLIVVGSEISKTERQRKY